MPLEYAFNGWLTAGIAAQCLLVLASRRLPAREWKVTAGLIAASLSVAFCGAPVLVPLVAAGATGFYLMGRAPARVGTAAVMSLTLTFWAERQGAYTAWTAAALFLSVLAFGFGVSRRSPPRAARLLLHLWYLSASAALLYGGLPDGFFEAALGEWSSASRVSILLTGAQFLLFAHALSGVLLLLPWYGPRGWKDAWARSSAYADSLVRGFDGAPLKSRWTLVLIAAQAVLLYGARRADPAQGGELARLLTLVALAHGAMRRS